MIVSFALGFITAMIVEYMWPGVFAKLKVAAAGIVAALAGFWEQLSGLVL